MKPILNCEEGDVYGNTYYVVQVDGRPTYGDYSIWEDMIGWVTKTFGPTAPDGVWTPNMRWYVNNARFWFRDEKDREWFILRWS
jgi:hypothetical protein